MGDADNPLKSSKNFPDSQANQWVTFRVSDHKKDAGQSTVPYWDTQPVETDPSSALGGVGLFHMGAPDYGGFVTLRLIDLNRSYYWKDNSDDQE